MNNAPAARKKILIVDDDKTIQAILTALLERSYDISSALDAVHGTMSARKNQPDLVLLDVNMPAGGGASVYERLTSLKDVFAGAILVYSVLPKDEVRKRFPSLGEDQILTKPASPEEILSAVERVLGPKDGGLAA